MEREAERTLCDMVFVGFNSRVVALDRRSGEKVWSWVAPRGTGFVAVLLDGDQLVVSCNGYTYALRPETGETLWQNPLEGEGTGIPCLASVYGSTSTAQTAYMDEQRRKSD